MGFPQRSSGRRSFGRSKRLSMARSLDDLEVRFPRLSRLFSLCLSLILTYCIKLRSIPILSPGWSEMIT